MATYPAAYHKACAHLVAHGAHGGNTTTGRQLCADALRSLRVIDPTLARHSRRGMLFISGMFPIKPQGPGATVTT